MSRMGKVVVAMSGGVDSAVAAALLHEAGYECVGVFMRIGSAGAAADQPEAERRGRRHGCCSVADALDARAIAARLGIPFYVLNFEHEFEQIVEYFVDEYARARTPNPCIVCNRRLKFGKLLRYADLLEAEYVATGHYARIVRQDGKVRLARSRNQAKDQSYVLFGIGREDLPRCLFPLGEIEEKQVVRRIAAELGLPVHDKPDSQEICFVPDNDYKTLLRARRPETQRQGEIVDAEGRVVGRHGGVANFTIGQRRGLRVAAGRPMYVTRLDVLENRVIIGPREALLAESLEAEDVNWLVEPPPTGEEIPCAIKIRHQHTPAGGHFRLQSDRTVAAKFKEPQPAVTPGQAAVFYQGEIVLGGGWIRSAGAANPVV